ncbi:MAG TPA: hypothetical protein ENI66_00210, partial [Candidatus Yonathbacteria bacterium]|nr:hypothetical protein [Candidatus Yonathbacteria bacterium]
MILCIMTKRHSRTRQKKWMRSFFKDVFFVFITIGFFLGGILFLWVATINVPDFSSFETRKVAQSTKIYDRTGEILLYDVHADIKRTVVNFDSISRFIKNATVAIEDVEFYNHIGVRPIATLRAVFIQPLRGKGVQGGSTITQQVVKNTILTPERTISRKFKEWVLAIRLEQKLSKDAILELYLNESPYGGNIYGIEEASLSFFGKSSKDVTLAEAAYLAALPQAPTFYSPYGNNTTALDDRKNLVLSRMLELNYITQEEYISATQEEVEFLPPETFGIKAPHFVIWVREYLEKKYGKEVVENGGLKVTTTLDYSLQQKAEEIVARYGEENALKFNANNAGVIGINPKTGGVLVMVGSRDYFDVKNEGNFNVTLGHRQPGSAFKPFVYATAFEKGYTPETILFNLRTQFSTLCDSSGNPLYSEVDPKVCYMPRNYDHKYGGPVTMRDALAQSINIPAIKTLYLTGIKNSLDTAVRMGIKGLADPSKYGLTLVLGGGEVSLLDITSAYGVFANNGVRNPYVSILKVEDNKGRILEEFRGTPEQVISTNVARQISDILSDNDARAPAFGTRSPLYFPNRDVAVKTGTTNDYKDAWIIGYTPNFALGAWVGNNNSTSMKKKVAGFIVAPMWNEIMKEALSEIPEETFGILDTTASDSLSTPIKPVLRGIWRGGKVFYTDKISGKLATQYTPVELRQENIVPEVHNILYWVNKKSPMKVASTEPNKDPQFNLWEYPVRKWVEENNIIEG